MGGLTACYLLILLLFSIPAVQQGCGDAVANALRERLKTELQVGRIKPGLPNRLILDDILIYDQSDTLMLRVSRMAAKVELLPLLKQRIRIRNAQLFGAHATLYKPSADEPHNFQFLIDAFASKDTARTPIDLEIGSLIVRRSSVRYDCWGDSADASRFSPNHLSLSDISLNAQIRTFTPDSISVQLKKCSLREASGIQLERAEATVEVGHGQSVIRNLTVALPHSMLSIPLVEARHEMSPLRTKPGVWLRGTTYEGELEGQLRLNELAPFVPKMKDAVGGIGLRTHFKGKGTDLSLPSMLLTNASGETMLKAAVEMEGRSPIKEATLRAEGLTLALRENDLAMFASLLNGDGAETMERAKSLCPIGGEGRLAWEAGTASARIDLTTAAGTINVDGKMAEGNDVEGDIQVTDIQPALLMPQGKLNDLGALSLTSKVNGRLKGADGRPQLRAQGTVDAISYKGYTYRDIRFEASTEGRRMGGSIGMQDENGDVEIQFDTRMGERRRTLNCYAALVGVNPHELGLTDRFEGEHVTLNLDAELEGSSADDMAGRIYIGNLCIHSEDVDDYLADSIVIESNPDEGEKHLWVKSPFVTANLDGQFRWRNLPGTVAEIMETYLPSVFRKYGQSGKLTDDLTFSAHIQDTTFMERLTGKPLRIPQPSTIDGKVDGNLRLLTFNAQVPEISYGGEVMKHIDCHVQSTAQNMQMSMQMEREVKGFPVLLGVNAYSSDDELRTRFHWDNTGQQTQIGEFDVTGHFYKDLAGKQAIRGDVNQSNLIINDTVWTVHPSKFNYHDGIVELDSFRVSKAEKYLCVNGRVSENENDTLVADLHQISLSYIFDLINFHAVDFDGKATGRIYASGLREKPHADAFLQVKNFTFNGGAMGDMDVHGNWGGQEGSIYLDALMNDPAANHQTTVTGTITPNRSHPNYGLDLDIRTQRCNLYFLNKYTRNIFANLEGRATGRLRIYGPFKGINLNGDLVVDEASTHVNALGVDYRMAGDSVILRPDNIWIRGARLYDNLGRAGMNEHCAILDVHLMHNTLKNLRYDVQAEARNVLGYDFRDFGDMSFYATIYATGNVKLSGRPGEMTADISGSPMPGSTIVYNSTSPETITEAGFITYVNPKEEGQKELSTATDTEEETTLDMRLNFNLNITSDATLRVLMDARSGDYINLHGNGHILANYYNKGKFSMYGTYRVEDGIYKLSLQDVIRKDFQFQEGGTISFGGNAQQAALNLKAVYTVPNVSMNDLSATSLGLSNTRVDCIMNIGGHALAPLVTFDFDLPSANEDEKEMVRQMITTEEERNMQVIYLLGIGRFYSYESQYATGNNQSTNAMNSFLSSSLSSQFNQILSNAMGTDKWSFGANLRTGETGWDQLDVEGILSGRLLNNRLLINGNFGYRESYYSTSNFIGDFDVRYLLTRSGSVALKAYNQTNDRYFIQSSLTTQGIGIQFQKDFNRWRELLPKKRKKNKK